MKIKYSGIFLILLLMSVQTIHAAALSNLDQSASAAGVANAFTATANDPSAMYYNPAGLAWQGGTSVMFTGTLRFQDQSNILSGNTGVAPNTETPSNLGSVYAAWMPRDQNWGLGLAILSPYSVNTGWGSTVFGGSAQRTSLDTFQAALDYIYAVDSSMAFAFGADIYAGRIDVDTSTTQFHGTDNASFGGHVSWMWHPKPAWSIGALYRSRTTMNLNGTFTGAAVGNGKTQLTLPDTIRFGVAHDIQDGIKLEMDGSWVNWSRLSDMNITGATTQLNTLNLRDSFSVMTGLTWTWREDSQFRFGYAFDQASNRNTGVNARLPDNTGHRVTLGAGADVFGLHADVAYAYTLFTDHTVSGSAPFNGVYRNREQSLALSIAKKF